MNAHSHTLHKIKWTAESSTVGPSAQCSTHTHWSKLQVRGHKKVPSYHNIHRDLPHSHHPILPAFPLFIYPPLFTPFCSAVISHFVSSKWLLTVLTELSFFVCSHHKCVCQSQAYVLCIFTSLLWPIQYLRKLYFCKMEGVVCHPYFFFFFAVWNLFQLIFFTTSGVPNCSKSCCCSFSANLFSLWLPFSQWLPSLQAFSPTLLSLRLSPTLSFILSLFSLPIIC